jgi:hypothetical protein
MHELALQACMIARRARTSRTRIKIAWEEAYAKAFAVQISADVTAFSDLYRTARLGGTSRRPA